MYILDNAIRSMQLAASTEFRVANLNWSLEASAQLPHDLVSG